MSEFISGIFWGIVIAIWFRAGIAAIDWYRRRKMLREHPGGILKIDLDEAPYRDTNLELAKLHRERPDIAIILNGKRF